MNNLQSDLQKDSQTYSITDASINLYSHISLQASSCASL